MRLNELFPSMYAWADGHGAEILTAGVFLPIAGTILARVGKAGRTDSDGRFVASALIGFGVLAVLTEALALALATSVLGVDLGQANVQLLLAPILCLVLSLIGVRWVFPLSELASVRTVLDLGVFLAACGAAVFFFSKFRGWGIVFFGSFTELVVFLILGGLLLRRLFRRTFGLSGGPSGTRSEALADEHLERVRRMSQGKA